MEDLDEDYVYEIYNDPLNGDADEKDQLEP